MRTRLGAASICAKLTTLLLVSITATMSLLVATYTRVPSVLAAALGAEPTKMIGSGDMVLVSTTLVGVAVLITDTVLLPVGHIQPGAADRQRAG